MRKPTLAAASAALAAAALLIGAGTASAEPADQLDPVDQDVEAGCVDITTWVEAVRCMNLDPATMGATGSIGYGSFGTGSLADLLTGIINTASVTLSVDVPNATGSYAPGSLGSYGPEAAIGELSVASIGSLAGAS